MKSTGVVRTIDDLGRLTLPMELRKTLDLLNKDSIEIFTDEDMIVLKKYEPACTFCGEAREVENFKGKNICGGCLRELKIR